MKKIIYLVFIFSASFLYANAKTFYVKDFGAIINDGKDDTSSIQNCINEAIKHENAQIIFEPGIYNLNNQLVLDYTTSSIQLSGTKALNNITELHSTSEKNIIGVRGYYANPSTGSFKINDFKIKGYNKPFSAMHNKANKPNWSAAIIVTDIRNVIIDYVTIENFYGQGIQIASTNRNANGDDRFNKVEITNNRIIDVWGFHPKGDDYGDAIYLSNVVNGIVKNNYIENSLQRTKQLGRCGIVLEYLCENIKVINNQVKEGYDRPLHIENTLGGHLVENNTFYGSDLGIVVVENLDKPYKKTEILKNKISNINLRKDITYTKSYNEGNYGDRSLVFLLTNMKTKNEMIIFKNNQLKVYDDFVYNSNAIINNRSKNVSITNNEIRSLNSKKNYFIFNYAKGVISNNKASKNIRIQ